MPREASLSVYRTQGVARTRLWRIGRLIASGTRAGVLYGRAELDVGEVHNVKLKFKAGHLPSLHVDVVGWPADDEQGKAAQLLMAEKLANHARFESTPS